MALFMAFSCAFSLVFVSAVISAWNLDAAGCSSERSERLQRLERFERAWLVFVSAVISAWYLDAAGCSSERSERLQRLERFERAWFGICFSCYFSLVFGCSGVFVRAFGAFDVLGLVFVSAVISAW
jgi:hypothetical protein